MKLDTKLKLLTVNIVTGTLAMTIGLVMLPAVKERRHKAAFIAISAVGTVTVALTLKEIHRIDVAMNKGEIS